MLVVTVRALKMHGGGPAVTPGAPLDFAYTSENLELVRAGCANMQHHIRNANKFGVPVVVAVNHFTSDTDAEVAVVRDAAKEAGAYDAVLARHWAEGGQGAKVGWSLPALVVCRIVCDVPLTASTLFFAMCVWNRPQDLALAVKRACAQTSRDNFKFLYPLELSIKEKIERIATEIYGAAGVTYSDEAEAKIALFTRCGFDALPICMAKTHLSLSADPTAKNVPTGFTIPIRDIRCSAGAGFLYPLVRGGACACVCACTYCIFFFNFTCVHCVFCSALQTHTGRRHVDNARSADTTGVL